MYPLKNYWTGTGHPDYILPIALKEIAAAEVILCGTRHAESFDASGKEMPLSVRETPLSVSDGKRFAVHQTRKTALVVSGDCGFYSLLTYAKSGAGKGHCLYSRNQFATVFLAKLAISWEDARLMSLHGRDQDLAGRPGGK